MVRPQEFDYTLEMDFGGPRADPLSRALLLAPLLLLCLACVALAFAKPELASSGHFYGLFFTLLPAASLQLLVLVPLALRWLPEPAERSARLTRRCALALAGVELAALLWLALPS